MKDIFNFKRFFKYLGADAKNCLANYGLGMMLIPLLSIITYIGKALLGYLFTGAWAGPGEFLRIATFIILMAVLMISMPAKCYGFITSKKKGTEWLMIPVSSFEKFLSMIIMTIIVIPIVVGGLYLGIDALLCVIDKNCGASIMGKVVELHQNVIEMDSRLERFPNLARFVSQVLCPWLYLDDILSIFLLFLLGSTLFKKAKAVLTILSTSAILTVLGVVFMIVSIIFLHNSDFHITFDQLFMGTVAADQFPEEAMRLDNIFSGFIFRHVALLDTLTDTVVNLAMLGLIYLRIKTIKH